ncbi:UNVERIFIED_CONTAM: hypothetical protein HDU68_007296, partial [Siphonaria sp. JEL0065]
MALYTSIVSTLMHIVMLAMVMLKIGLYRQAQREIQAQSDRIRSRKRHDVSAGGPTATNSSSKKGNDGRNAFGVGDYGVAGSTRDYSVFTTDMESGRPDQRPSDTFSNISAISSVTDLAVSVTGYEGGERKEKQLS